MSYDVTKAVGQVRLLINDTSTDPVFADTDVAAFLAMEGDNVKRAAAQALDTIADDEALTSKAIRTQDLATDGPKVADSLRKRAAALRDQADRADADADDGFFAIVPMGGHGHTPELTQHAHFPGYWP
ncbi:hypothetical protein [Nocardioides sp. SYSU D00065]|uniref:hypothetical protein n=1 Tax=Nocardioides sp. SYSU D00065 TaxID=2817378 RepID=UPI001B32A811|nr:hypothetical protein [Nocardioides sp. SYSU D00065]